MFTSEKAVVQHGTSLWTMPDGRTFTVTRLPLWDPDNRVFARLYYRRAAQRARELGGRLLTRAEVDDIWKRGFRTRPVTLWEPGKDAEMMTLEWARRHDEGVREQLLFWDRVTPVANVGKDYLADAPPGKQHYYGWIEDGVALQPDWMNAHNDLYSDYSQLTRIAWDHDGSAPANDDGEGLSFGGTLLALGALGLAGYVAYQFAVNR